LKILVTGGAGFVGSNLTWHLASSGHTVVVFDNFSRRGARANAQWLQGCPGHVTLVQGDVRDREALRRAAEGCGAIFHLAAQVAVTTSVQDPVTDFEVNARGTLNVLETARELDCAVIYTSTNKVYGALDDIPISLSEDGKRYRYASSSINGIPETQPLDFHSPYGCSKGAADQYVLDYSRIYALKTCVFRMSCIYGPRQFGNEDQGWVAHFVISALCGRPITIYGDGRQVRDVLFVEDLIRGFEAALSQIDALPQRVFNIGGGPRNTLSLLELIDQLQELTGHRLQIDFGEWRPGDQRVYVSDVSRAEAVLGWKPTVSPQEGVRRLYLWARENYELLCGTSSAKSPS
jgi:CDP-paratose 2-epimerase